MSQSYNFSSYSLTTEIVPSNLTQTRFFLGTQNEDSVTVTTDPLDGYHHLYRRTRIRSLSLSGRRMHANQTPAAHAPPLPLWNEIRGGRDDCKATTGRARQGGAGPKAAGATSGELALRA